MSKPIENCPMPETPIRERAWTAEQVEKEADEMARYVNASLAAIAMLHTYAATLRQQAERVGDGYKSFEQRFSTGHRKTDTFNFTKKRPGVYAADRIQAIWEGWQAALAQNTQAEQPCSLSEALNVIENWGMHGNTLEGDDVHRFRALADKIAPQNKQAERQDYHLTSYRNGYEQGKFDALAERTGDAGEAVAWMDSGSNRCSRKKHPGFISPQPLYLHPPAQQPAVVVLDDVRSAGLWAWNNNSERPVLERVGAVIEAVAPLLAGGVPDGMVLVPIAGSDAILDAMARCFTGQGKWDAAMLAARPSQPKDAQDGAL